MNGPILPPNATIGVLLVGFTPDHSDLADKIAKDSRGDIWDPISRSSNVTVHSFSSDCCEFQQPHSVALLNWEGGLTKQKSDLMKKVATVAVVSDNDVNAATAAVDAGAVEALFASEISNSKIVIDSLISSLKRRLVKEHLASLQRSSREANRLEQEVYARLALLPVSSIREMFGLLCAVLEDQALGDGSESLKLIHQSIYQLLSSDLKVTPKKLNLTQLDPIIELLKTSLALKGVKLSVVHDIDYEDISESQRSECIELLMHAAVVALFSAGRGAELQAQLSANRNGTRVEITGPSSMLPSNFAQSDSFLAELLGGVLRVSVDGSLVKYTLLRTSEPFQRSNIIALVVDDNQINALLLERVLVKDGYTTIVCSDGLEALEICKTSKIDVGFIDIHMPRMDGVELSNKIRNELHLDIPLYACSADLTEENRKRCLNAKMNGFIAKPYSTGEIRGLMTALAERHKRATNLTRS